ncbi:hypothetical protein PCS_02109 [Desulfocurvibacter africanus PCS]|uniref:Uncharacterized protein n=1 Tax=Desulfocurvibacter africanus PCS TaxID=1262666 RepID=M5Q152_DESAF|nr:DUF1015 family protein [Desulfocurvibacter africanus]EMG37271.1 hypothetical protein PCS_02109 [Desulfocurvibacter africanus PCS]
MPEFVPLPLHRYNPARPDLPPEWTSAPAGPHLHGPELSLLAAKSPCNVVHVERLGTADTSAETLRRWLGEDILTPMEPGFLLLRSELPNGRARWSLLGGVPLVSVAEGGLLRLEDVNPSQRDDRLARMRSAKAQFAPVLGLLEPDSGLNAFATHISRDEPLMECRQGDGVRHILWRVPQLEEPVAQTVIKGGAALVTGGHTTLAAALALWAEQGPGTPGNRKPWDYVLCCLTDGSPDGLDVAPVHRVLTWFRKFDWETLLTKAEERFHVRPATMPEDLAMAGDGAFLLYLPTTLWLLIPREPVPDTPADNPQAAEADALLARCPAHVLERGFLRGVLGLGDEELARHFLDYFLSPEEALRLVRGGEAQAAFILRPTPLADLRAMATAGRTLPARSVAVPPCVPSGLVFYLHGQ